MYKFGETVVNPFGIEECDKVDISKNGLVIMLRSNGFIGQTLKSECIKSVRVVGFFNFEVSVIEIIYKDGVEVARLLVRLPMGITFYLSNRYKDK